MIFFKIRYSQLKSNDIQFRFLVEKKGFLCKKCRRINKKQKKKNVWIFYVQEQNDKKCNRIKEFLCVYTSDNANNCSCWRKIPFRLKVMSHACMMQALPALTPYNDLIPIPPHFLLFFFCICLVQKVAKCDIFSITKVSSLPSSLESLCMLRCNTIFGCCCSVKR